MSRPNPVSTSLSGRTGVEVLITVCVGILRCVNCLLLTYGYTHSHSHTHTRMHTHTHTHTHRVSGLFFIVLLQLWIGWTFISYQMVRSSAAEAEKTNGAPAPSPSEQLVV